MDGEPDPTSRETTTFGKSTDREREWVRIELKLNLQMS